MVRFSPQELYEVFLVVDEDGAFDCPIFTAFEEESTGVAKCLALSQADKKAMQQALRLAKQELANEIGQIDLSYQFGVRENAPIHEVEEQIEHITSRLCKLMSNYIK